ncbi:MAG: cytochrome b [Legionellaceae bacterium]|nr:cytochrome b [Legionellaceae bacterium]
MVSLESSRSYSSGSKWLHWLIAAIVLPMLIFTFFFDALPERFFGTAITLHKSFGMLVLFLMLWRIVWITRTGKPPLPATVPIWQRIASRLVQHGLYVLVIAMPLVGWIMSTAANKSPVIFGLFTLPLPGITPDKALAKNMFQTHQILAWVIIFFLILHIAGALKHHFIDKDNVLKRMLPDKQ